MQNTTNVKRELAVCCKAVHGGASEPCSDATKCALDGGMTDGDREFLEWLRDQVKRSPRGIRSRLAEALEVDRSQVTLILAGKRKRITAEEQRRIYKYFKQNPPDADLSSPNKPGGVIVMGRVGVWESKSDAISKRKEVVPSPSAEYSQDEQLAYRIAKDSGDGEFLENDYVFTVPYNVTKKIKEGEEFVVKCSRGDLICYTLKRAVKKRGKVALEPVVDTRTAETDEAEIVGVVIGVFQRRPRNTRRTR